VVNSFTPEPAAMLLASRLQAETATLATKWVDQVVEMLVAYGAEVFPSRDILHDIPDFIAEIAQYLRLPDSEQISCNSGVMRSAAELGRIRFRQRATVHQLLREYQVLADLLEGFLLAEVANADPPLEAEATTASAYLAGGCSTCFASLRAPTRTATAICAVRVSGSACRWCANAWMQPVARCGSNPRKDSGRR
jgi:hypothetical protein